MLSLLLLLFLFLPSSSSFSSFPSASAAPKSLNLTGRNGGGSVVIFQQNFLVYTLTTTTTTHCLLYCAAKQPPGVIKDTFSHMLTIFAGPLLICTRIYINIIHTYTDILPKFFLPLFFPPRISFDYACHQYVCIAVVVAYRNGLQPASQPFTLFPSSLQRTVLFFLRCIHTHAHT